MVIERRNQTIFTRPHHVVARRRFLPCHRPGRSLHQQPRHHHRHPLPTLLRPIHHPNHGSNTRLHRRHHLHHRPHPHRHPLRPPSPNLTTPPLPTYLRLLIPPLITGTPLHPLPHNLPPHLRPPPLPRPNPPRLRRHPATRRPLLARLRPDRRRLRRRLLPHPDHLQRRLGRRELRHELGDRGYGACAGRDGLGRGVFGGVSVGCGKAAGLSWTDF